MEAEIITDYRSQVGETPIWHPIEKALYWVDMPEGRVLRVDPATGRYDICYSGEPVGGLTIQADGALLVFIQNGVVGCLQHGQWTEILSGIPGFQGYGFNDMIADPKGRVFWGSISADFFSGKREGGLYRVDVDGSVKRVADDISVSNGLGFSPQGDRLYHTDTLMRRIYAYDYDKDSGDLGRRRVFVEIPEEAGAPDGMTVDAQGNVWTALWGGGCVICFSPQGVEARRVPIPARKASSVTFGGDDYTDMYVTSAIAGPGAVDEWASAGALFRIHAGVKGVPEFFSAISLF